MDPVPKGKPYVSNSPLGANTEKVASSSSSLFSPVSASLPIDVQAAVSICQKTREEQLNKLEKINSEESFVVNIRSLEQELIVLRVPYVEFLESKLAGNPKEARRKEAELGEKTETILESYKNMGLSLEDFRFLYQKGGTLIDFECNLQIILCKLLNQRSYESQVREFIKNNRGLIFAQIENRGITIPPGIKGKCS